MSSCLTRHSFTGPHSLSWVPFPLAHETSSHNILNSFCLSVLFHLYAEWGLSKALLCVQEAEASRISLHNIDDINEGRSRTLGSRKY